MRSLTDTKRWPYPFDIPRSDLQQITELDIHDPNIRFDTSFTDHIFGKAHSNCGVGNIKAFLYLIPTLFVPRLKYNRTKKPLTALRKAASLML
ncbi:hypothetical protein [Parasitella parasitica]|uniref:Uncharacterized protein n=1 Tax=Parasitella parasitica TaxID=35722 RepID=A0A0B7NJ18_9FUNG|nr:hypothetical protein [Parasitella parasitica]